MLQMKVVRHSIISDWERVNGAFSFQFLDRGKKQRLCNTSVAGSTATGNHGDLCPVSQASPVNGCTTREVGQDHKSYQNTTTFAKEINKKKEKKTSRGC